MSAKPFSLHGVERAVTDRVVLLGALALGTLFVAARDLVLTVRAAWRAAR